VIHYGRDGARVAESQMQIDQTRLGGTEHARRRFVILDDKPQSEIGRVKRRDMRSRLGIENVKPGGRAKSRRFVSPLNELEAPSSKQQAR